MLSSFYVGAFLLPSQLVIARKYEIVPTFVKLLKWLMKLAKFNSIVKK